MCTKGIDLLSSRSESKFTMSLIVNEMYSVETVQVVTKGKNWLRECKQHFGRCPNYYRKCTFDYYAWDVTNSELTFSRYKARSSIISTVKFMSILIDRI